MKPRIFKLARRIALFLLLGAIINVAVAWGIAISDERPHHTGIWISKVANVSTDESLWNRHATDAWPDPPSWHSEWYGPFSSGRAVLLSVGGSFLVPIDATTEQLREIYRGAGSFEIWQANFGFPVRATRIEEWRGDPMESALFPATSGHDGFTFGKYRVPRTTLWPGFAINTIFYAAMLWLAFAAVGRLRRRRRIKRGLCPACAYDLRGVGDSAVCTECGGKVTPARMKLS